jgi:phosphoribosylanthranilate isomerase
MKIKVCGLKDVEQMRALDAMQVDYAGIIFFKGSKRCIGDSGEQAITMVRNLTLPKVGVFVNQPLSEVVKAIEDFDLYAVQLHGEESPAYAASLPKGIKRIKAFAISAGSDIDQMVLPYIDHVEFFLFDTSVDGTTSGGTGKKFDWSILEKFKIGKPFFLSGGIGPGDEKAIADFHHPFFAAIDVNSRFEIAPGIKDLDAINNFIQQVSTNQEDE